MLYCLRDHVSLNHINTIMTDKHLFQRQCIKKVFPKIHLALCLVHVRKWISKKINQGFSITYNTIPSELLHTLNYDDLHKFLHKKHTKKHFHTVNSIIKFLSYPQNRRNTPAKVSLNRSEKIETTGIFEQIIRSRTTKEADSLMGKFSWKVKKYFIKEWSNYDEYVFSLRPKVLDLCQETSNRVEGSFSLLKAETDSERSLDVFFQQYLNFLESYAFTLIEKQKILGIRIYRSVYPFVNQFSRLLTRRACVILEKIYVNSIEMDYTYSFRLDKNSRSCPVCPFVDRLGLPCVHIIKVNSDYDFLRAYINSFWLKDRLIKVFVPGLSINVPVITEFNSKYTRNRKKNKSFVSIDDNTCHTTTPLNLKNKNEDISLPRINDEPTYLGVPDTFTEYALTSSDTFTKTIPNPTKKDKKKHLLDINNNNTIYTYHNNIEKNPSINPVVDCEQLYKCLEKKAPKSMNNGFPHYEDFPVLIRNYISIIKDHYGNSTLKNIYSSLFKSYVDYSDNGDVMSFVNSFKNGFNIPLPVLSKIPDLSLTSRQTLYPDISSNHPISHSQYSLHDNKKLFIKAITSRKQQLINSDVNSFSKSDVESNNLPTNNERKIKLQELLREKLISNDKERIIAYGSSIEYSSIEALLNNKCIDDSILNVFVKKLNLRRSPLQNYLVMPTFLSSTLLNHKNYAYALEEDFTKRISRFLLSSNCASTVATGRGSFTGIDSIYIPIFIGADGTPMGHWTLLHMNNLMKRISYYDSMLYESYNTVFAVFKDFFCYYDSKMDCFHGDYEYVAIKEITRQKGVDCGVHVMQNIQILINGEYRKIIGDEIGMLRLSFAEELLGINLEINK